MKKILFICSLALLLGCKKDGAETNTIPKEGYLIFGSFYGECRGEQCVEIFELTPNNLAEDTKDTYPLLNSNNFYVGDFGPLPQAKFEIAKHLWDTFPTALLAEKDTVIGMPDAGDWGGIYLEYHSNNTHRVWFLDQMKTNVPSQYHSFIDKVNATIKLLQ